MTSSDAVPPAAAAGRTAGSPDTRSGQPETPTQQVVAEVWGEVLGAAALPGDSFFALGGDEHTAARVLAGLHTRTGVELPVDALTVHPTLRAFAAHVDRSLRDGLGALTAGQLRARLDSVLGTHSPQPDPSAPLAAPASLASPASLPEPGAGAAEASTRDITEDPVPVHRLFARWAARTPASVALTDGGEHFRYGELDARANRLAHRLRQEGVGPGTRVGVSAHRSAWLVTGLLAVLKAGGCYVPLDPAYPVERLRLLAADAGVSVLLTGPGTRCWWRGDPGSVVHMTDDPALASLPDTPVADRSAPDDPAYIIHTSGSTGTPKGVLVPHRNISRLFTGTREWFGFGADEVWTLFHSCAFDFSVWEMWGALAHGGRLVVVPYATSREPAAFRRLLHEQRVTVLNQTPSAFHQLARADAALAGGTEPLALRWVVLGGEALDPAALTGWFARHGDTAPRVANMYGITEATVHTTFRRLTREDTADGRSGSPLGTPLPDLRVHVVDDRGRPVPLGVTGELYIGGAGLAEGYLGRPGLTAERFVPDPFGTGSGARLYRTGDLVRQSPDGELEYHGRIDDQIQLRGFRIEPAEIESALTAHSSVHESVVLPRTGPDGHTALAAYVTCHEGAPAVTVPQLRAHLSRLLPAHLVPADLAVLPQLPLTANGKVDRAALPAPGPAAAGTGIEYVAPRDAVEQTLCGVWARSLGVGRVGIDDNYFALGGDSIRSIRLLTLAREAGLQVDFHDLLEHQTVRSLAASARPAGDPSGAEEYRPFSLLSRTDRSRLPADVTDAYPMTRLQQGLLFHSDQDGSADGAVYHNVSAYRLRVQFDESAWRQALTGLLERHEILRTTFDERNFGEPLQLVHRHFTLPVAFEDLRGLSPADRDAQAGRAFTRERATRFDRLTAPLVRFRLQRLTDETVQLLVTEHHAVLDGWSERSLFVELLREYTRLACGAPVPPAAAPAARYASYVRLERQVSAGDAGRRFWTEVLAGATVTELPHPGGAGQDRSPARMRTAARAMPDGVSRGLAALARELGVPLRTVLLAAHLRVMSLLGGTDDVVTGAVYNGRSEEPDGDRVLGLFLNTLPLRARLAGGTWYDLVRQTAALDRDVQAHRRYPLADIVRHTGMSDPFEGYFNYTHFHVEEALPDPSLLEITEEHVVADTHFPFGAEFVRRGGSGALGLAVRFDAARFGEEFADRALGYYSAALTALAEDPGSRHETADLLDADEHRELAECNATAVRFDRPHTLDALIAEQMRRTPGATAVRYAGAELTCRELHERAERLAGVLRVHGAGPGTFVAVVLERSPDLLVSVLAVLRAGAAYVPLDPEHPPRRLCGVLTEAGITLAVTGDTGHRRLAGADVTTVRPDGTPHREPRAAAGQPCAAARAALPGDPAYMIFTSGSTGAPKGVVVPHRAISNRLLWLQREFPLGPGEAVLLKTPATFDVSVWELLWPLVAGGVVVVAPPGAHREPARLGELIAAESVSTVNFVPSMLQAFLDDPAGAAACGTLTRVLCSGEELTYDLQQRFFAVCGAELHNIYGPTEADLTHWRCVPDGSRTVPVGHPVANAEAHVLDPHGQPVPLGVTGELHLGGTGLAEGYHRRPDLTERAFIRHTDRAGVTRRLYRTGDLMRRLPGGALEFRGRTDRQIKVRGLRIEPGEVEGVLVEHEEIAEAAVVLRGERLAACVVPRSGALPSPERLARHAADRLPAHMVPAEWSLLERMPLTDSGKLDRAALGRLPAAPDGRPAPVPPRDAREARLLGLWRELLPGRHVGVHDDFFAAGGHSLLATRLVSRIRSEFGTEVGIRDLYARPTVAALAGLLTGGRQTRPALTAGTATEDDAPLSPAQEDLWLLGELDRPGAFNIPNALRLHGPLDREALARAWGDVLARHEPLRTVFPDRDGQRRQHVLASAESAELRLAEADPGELRRLLEQEAGHVFDLATEAPARAALFRLAPDEYVLILVIHHIASDGWSEGPLGRDLSTAYAARRAGEEPRWQPLPVRYRDYARWQHDLLGDRDDEHSVLARQLAHWRSVLAGLPAELPGARPRPAVVSERGEEVALRIPAAVHHGVTELALAHGASPFMVLQAALALVLCRTGAGEDVPVGTVLAGRTDDALDDMVGLFVNRMVMRTDLSGDPSFGQLLERVREYALTAYAHQDLPFELLAGELLPGHPRDRHPLYQVQLVLQNNVQGSLDLPGVRAVPVPLDHTTARFDVNIHLYEQFDGQGQPAGLEGMIVFAADLWDPATAAALARGLVRVLTEVTSRPELRVHEVDLGGGAAERPERS